MTVPMISRRQLVHASCAALAYLGASQRTKTWASDSPWATIDSVVVNANVYTMDPRMAKAEAFALKGDRFVALGTNSDIRRLIGKHTQIIDAQQLTVVPGFIDSHNHAPGNELLYEVLVGNPYDVEFVTIPSIVDKLRAKAAKTPPGLWVEGYFFDDTKVKDKRSL